MATDRTSGKRSATGLFRLSILRALADQLAERLAALEPDPLDLEHLREVADEPGVYQLYRRVEGEEKLVYIGKNDTSVAKRLREHHDKIKGRVNISLDEMSFTALYVPLDLHSVAPETHLIAAYKARGQAAWNGTGFGRHDPGQNRDQTVVSPNDFDAIYPVNLNWACDEIAPGTYTAADLLERVDAAVPFGFRYKTDDLHKSIQVTVDSENPTADQLFELIARAISSADPKWVITVLPGYVIMYDKPDTYPSALKQYR